MSNGLDRYYSILAGKEKAYFLLAKQIPVDFSSSQSDEELWDIHRRAMEEFRSFISHSSSMRLSGETGTSRNNRSLLDLKLELSRRMMSSCEICERRCHVNRLEGNKGICGVLDAKIASEFLHYGEEPPLVPSYTVFFSGCNFRCAYCQNHDISTNPQLGLCIPPPVMAEKISQRFGGRGGTVVASSPRDMSLMRALNVNWVGGDPTPNLHYIIDVLRHTSINAPQVWNSNMYLTQRSIALLDGLIDIYLTDFKYGNNSCAKRLSCINNYIEVITRNHIIAARQCEIIVRHLVLPNHVECCTKPVLRWIADNIPKAVVNVMDQYRPLHRAFEHSDINRPLKYSEFEEAYSFASELGLRLI